VAVIVPMTGCIVELGILLVPAYTMHLYKNNYSPIEASVLGDFTEADFSGYGGGQVITGWTTPVDSGAHRAIAHATTLVWTHGAGATNNDIYGYYVTQGADLIWAEAFNGGPVPMSSNGASLSVQPYYTARSEF
jgi:hypothetical protein